MYYPVNTIYIDLHLAPSCWENMQNGSQGVGALLDIPNLLFFVLSFCPTCRSF